MKNGLAIGLIALSLAASLGGCGLQNTVGIKANAGVALNAKSVTSREAIQRTMDKALKKYEALNEPYDKATSDEEKIRLEAQYIGLLVAALKTVDKRCGLYDSELAQCANEALDGYEIWYGAWKDAKNAADRIEALQETLVILENAARKVQTLAQLTSLESGVPGL